MEVFATPAPLVSIVKLDPLTVLSALQALSHQTLAESQFQIVNSFPLTPPHQSTDKLLFLLTTQHISVTYILRVLRSATKFPAPPVRFAMVPLPELGRTAP